MMKQVFGEHNTSARTTCLHKLVSKDVQNL